MPRYVDYHIGVDILDLRIDMLAEIIYALILQAHTVEHSLWCLCHSGIVIALARLQRGALYNNAAYLVKRYKIGKLQSVTKSSRGCHHGILEFQMMYIYA